MKRILTGKVVSNKMNKTVIVEVSRFSRHPVYHKDVLEKNKYAAHDEGNVYVEGDVVRIQESRPLSATKRWVVLGLASGDLS